MTALSCLIASSALLGSPVEADVAPAGRYVEARSASVYAGACHYNSEYVTQGREAVLAWRIERGAHAGVDLAGLSVAAAVVDDDNLDQAATRARRSVLYLPRSASERQRGALCAWVLARHAEQLGATIAVRDVELALHADAQGFELRISDELELRGGPMPNRECCKMPYNVWYTPFERIESRRVGHADVFALHEPALAAELARRDENCVYTGDFGVSRDVGGASDVAARAAGVELARR